VDGFAAHVDHLYEMATHAVAELRRRSPAFKLILEAPECTNISFWYIPPSLQGLDTEGEEFQEKINNVCLEFRKLEFIYSAIP
jgi:glutamate decarboxylase